jgi:hypothetical protein
MSQKLNSEIAMIGIDIGKNAFHLVGLDKRGANRAAAEVARPGGSAAGCLIGMCQQTLQLLKNARPWSGGPRMSASAYFLWKCFIHRRPTERA